MEISYADFCFLFAFGILKYDQRNSDNVVLSCNKAEIPL